MCIAERPGGLTSRYVTTASPILCQLWEALSTNTSSIWIVLFNTIDCTPNDILGFDAEGGRFAVISQAELERLELFRRMPPNVRDDLADVMRSFAKGWPG